MNIMACLFVLLFSFVVNAAHTIVVTEPAFTADKIELNPVTNSYVVVNPKYFVNASESVKIISDGWEYDSNYNPTRSKKTAQHLCSFLGMSGGKVISTSILKDGECINKTLTINDSGHYSLNKYSINHRCSVFEFLECLPK